MKKEEKMEKMENKKVYFHNKSTKVDKVRMMRPPYIEWWPKIPSSKA